MVNQNQFRVPGKSLVISIQSLTISVYYFPQQNISWICYVKLAVQLSANFVSAPLTVDADLSIR